MAANADLFEVAKVIRADKALSYEVIVTPSAQLMDSLRANPAAAAACQAIDDYLAVYGHMGTLSSVPLYRIHCYLSVLTQCLLQGTAWTSSSHHRSRTLQAC